MVLCTLYNKCTAQLCISSTLLTQIAIPGLDVTMQNVAAVNIGECSK